ncbi:class I SAM-dependent methyltransferase [Paenibacillus amylolyticus]|uniref:Class I SAM-dependent methyltransferase n=1 Tax=Paenibacillus amylolyticus TaxID=1451 RepID=A0A5M9X086_PAEAM|nr:class I SAM-dependent methyltransferase [Paenibacillus amylolyticus]KAA8787048.1 class I SAM-dependent methyltransferase [Paenibacillus amylolyticus]
MSDYYWDNQIEYLRKTRWLYYNDDYLEFLVERVWKIKQAVHMIDYGCGFGYMGLKLLPLLPVGSRYTGVDQGSELIKHAKELYAHTSYQAEFIEGDIETVQVERAYDIAISHAFLVHMTEPRVILEKMIGSVVDGGRVICFEPHWIANMASYALDGMEQSSIVHLGVLQKLYEQGARESGKDGNIGMKIPTLLSQLGVRGVECRVSDRVNFLDQQMDEPDKHTLYNALKEEGLGAVPGNRNEATVHLIGRGLTSEEAIHQYEAEESFAREFNGNSYMTYAPNMKITSGIVER